ncbi:olfactory receptor 13A1-like isoform X2 [Perognathus longimembris pacificus]|uniref:olfactory receptor 13A1-like isoform X2 n=1 Tax=Perognathus longimembris pacificus TaxID=214514 RepID=UPI002019071B|nr:olfactory receptor 13A1-like isoform X2 [Perognathus longimembris pacificus]
MMGNVNQTLVTEFILQGFSEHPKYQIFLFCSFLSLYCMALTGNALIIVAISFNPALHTPMYFFLFNLATMDIICTSTIMPKTLAGLMLEKNFISFRGCMAQLYFLTWSASSELLLLTVMAYDRYVAICHPLHYSTMMSQAFCSVLAAAVWAICAFNSAIHTGLMVRLKFCGPNVITHFFCEIPPLLRLSCSSTYVNNVMTTLADAFYGIVNFLMTIVSYGFIISSILRMRSSEGKQKAFSTCSSHLIVVCMYYTAVFYAYISPVSGYSAEKSKVAGVLYTIASPTLNPLIYTLRNMEVKASLRKLVPFFKN